MNQVQGPTNQAVKSPVDDSHSWSFLVASFFLLLPVTLLLIHALRAEPSVPKVTPEGPAQGGNLAEDYQRAVRQASRPGVAPVAHSLASLAAGPIKVVTWTRASQLSAFKDSKGIAFKDTWVTVVPYLKAFCQQFVKEHGPNPDALNVRLKQRLGLPLNAQYDTFVELSINPKDVSEFFRPCANPSISADSCEPAKPLTRAQLRQDLAATDPNDKNLVEQRYWFFNNYYNSFSGKDPYPWTSLGYTFDWARRMESSDLTTIGESEFVIPEGKPIQYVSDAQTVAYCTP